MMDKWIYIVDVSKDTVKNDTSNGCGKLQLHEISISRLLGNKQ